MNSHEDVDRVLSTFPREFVMQAQQVIRESRDLHPSDASCECEAMEVLGLMLRSGYRVVRMDESASG